MAGEAGRALHSVETPSRETLDRLVENVEHVVRGKRDVVQLAVNALLARGHVLLEDVPGVGKTTLGAALARSIGGSFSRVQFTSDLLPSDIIGVNVWDAESRSFEFRRGPIFANLVLADEINRTTPKTQSALLEAMSESTVTVDDRVHDLPHPFLVIATQNPVEQAGTFPLPDSQLDRFLLRTRMGYPSPEEEVEILRSGGRRALDDVQPVLSLEELEALRARVEAVAVHDDLAAYLVAIVNATRGWPAVLTGASPRASLEFYRAAQARALMDGRDHVLPDDIKALALPLLAHRLTPADGAANDRLLEARLAELVETVPVPL